jgi:hypothetical protein
MPDRCRRASANEISGAVDEDNRKIIRHCGRICPRRLRASQRIGCRQQRLCVLDHYVGHRDAGGHSSGSGDAGAIHYRVKNHGWRIYDYQDDGDYDAEEQRSRAGPEYHRARPSASPSSSLAAYGELDSAAIVCIRRRGAPRSASRETHPVQRAGRSAA